MSQNSGTLPNHILSLQTTSPTTEHRSLFEVMYDSNPTNVVDLIPTPIATKITGDVEELGNNKQIHEQVHQQIVKSKRGYNYKASG